MPEASSTAPDARSEQADLWTQLREAMIHDHADANDLDMAALGIDIESLVVWGSFLPPVPSEHTRLSLTDLALQNLIALPIGNKTLYNSSSSPLPTWLTVDYVEAVITRIDIGKTYPALIKNKRSRVRCFSAAPETRGRP